MKTEKKLSPKRINYVREQGYVSQCDEEIRQLAFGNRFAYRLCVTLLIPGVLFANIPTLSVMLLVAILGVALPNHPFDYIYNGLLSKRMGKPKLPKRSKQLKFACSLATAFIGATIILFYHNFMLSGYIVGGSLIAVASLVSTIDVCIPSKIYNAIFSVQLKPAHSKS